MRGWWFCGATATTSRSNAEEYPNILHQGDETLKLAKGSALDIPCA